MQEIECGTLINWFPPDVGCIIGPVCISLFRQSYSEGLSTFNIGMTSWAFVSDMSSDVEHEVQVECGRKSS